MANCALWPLLLKREAAGGCCISKAAADCALLGATCNPLASARALNRLCAFETSVNDISKFICSHIHPQTASNALAHGICILCSCKTTGLHTSSCLSEVPAGHGNNVQLLDRCLAALDVVLPQGNKGKTGAAGTSHTCSIWLGRRRLC